MKFFDGEKLEVVLKPNDLEVNHMIKTARAMMLEKMDRWILDQLTVEQLANCIEQFKKELIRRRGD